MNNPANCSEVKELAYSLSILVMIDDSLTVSPFLSNASDYCAANYSLISPTSIDTT